MEISDKLSKFFSLKKLRDVITKAVYLFIFSIILFETLSIDQVIYIIISFGVWIILLLNYKKKENICFYSNATSLCLCNLLAFIFTNYLKGEQINVYRIDIIYLVYAVVLLISDLYFLYLQLNTKVKDVKEENLFPQRKYDLERIIYYLNYMKTIGINASWGSGKSFLINSLKTHPDIQEKYIFIQIDLLSCNLDDIQNILLNEMEKVLYNNRIFSKHSKKLKKILREQTQLQNLGAYFVHDDVSFSDAIAGFCHELECLCKTIVIIYEDIDRINNPEVIRKIFSISEKFSNYSVKIIYQFDEENLKEIDSRLDRDYVEKYIPYIINLTEINFFDILETLFRKRNISKDLLTLDDFLYLKLPINVDPYLTKTLPLPKRLEIVMGGATIRKVEYFLNDLITSLNEKELYRMKENKRDVITFYFIKHFLYHMYERFNLEDGLLETFWFEHKGKKYNIQQLIRLYEKAKVAKLQPLTAQDIKNIFNETENRESLVLLSMFEYKYNIYQVGCDEEDISNETVTNITNKNINEKKNRLIWNLLYNGKPEYTNQELLVKKLDEMVLSKPSLEQEQSFKEFLQIYFNEAFEDRVNTKPCRCSISTWNTLFQAFCVENVSKEQWLAFLNLYFRYGEVKDIDLDLIENLKYGDISSKEVYIYILDKFNKLNIIGNMNNKKSYKYFLKNYLQALSSLQYVDTEELSVLEDKDDDMLDEKFIQDMVLKQIKDKMEEQKKLITINSIQRDIDTIIAFIQKNHDIIGNPKNLEYKNINHETKIKKSYIHQTEYDRLKNLDLSEEDYLQEVEESYKAGKIGTHEIINLINLKEKN